MRTIADRVLIQPVDESPATSGGILLPENARPLLDVREAVVVSPPLDHDYAGGDNSAIIKEGDHILFNRYQGTPVKINGIDYHVIQTAHIIAVL